MGPDLFLLQRVLVDDTVLDDDTDIVFVVFENAHIFQRIAVNDQQVCVSAWLDDSQRPFGVRITRPGQRQQLSID